MDYLERPGLFVVLVGRLTLSAMILSSDEPNINSVCTEHLFRSVANYNYISIENPKEFGVEHPLQFCPFFPLIAFPTKIFCTWKGRF